jgi:ribonucleoside-diphosphate reductase alpha chain
MSYDVSESFDASMVYFDGDELASSVFSGKYSLPDGAGKVLELTPLEMHRRVAREFARVESSYDNAMSEDEIFELLADWTIVPQGSPLSGIGNWSQIQSLSNCFVIEAPQDSYAGILRADQEQVQIMKRRGGVGFDVSKIRPKGEPTANAARTTDGIAVFMDRFSNSCREVAQGGRRGALMLTIDCRHPEVETFIDIKRDRKRVTGANISVRFNDEFMTAVDNGGEYVLRWPVDASLDDAVVTKTVRAREVWEKFVDSAWECAEPGALFWDTVQSGPADCYSSVGYETVSTNPCAEIPLSPYDSCRLMVVNLMNFVRNPFLETAWFDYEEFKRVVSCAQRLMDDLIDLETEAVDRIISKIMSDPEPQDVKQIEIDLWKKVKEATLGGRRTGLGVTALGDALAALGLKYGTNASIEATDEIYMSLAVAAYTSSIQLASERGAFPVYDPMLEEGNAHLQRIYDRLPGNVREMALRHGRRNIALTTTAPVGSVSCLTQTTSGIEPAYLLSYTRRKKIVEHGGDTRVDFVDDLGDRWQEFTVYHHGVKAWMEATGKTEIDESCPYWGATSPEIDWVQSVKIQAAAQKWVCHGISKTCNLPSDVSKEVVNEVYLAAWKAGCKGFTVYRDGSRSGVLISAEEKDQEQDDGSREKIAFKPHSAPKRPDELECEIHHATIKGEKWTILVGLLGGRPYEVLGGLAEFVEIPSKYTNGCIRKRSRKTRNSIYDLVFGENGDEVTIKDVVRVFDNPNYAGYTRMISLALRHGAPIHYVVEQLQKDRDADLFSFAKVISRVLKRFIVDGAEPGGGKQCPSCGEESLTYQEGCVTCLSCGYGKCG